MSDELFTLADAIKTKLDDAIELCHQVKPLLKKEDVIQTLQDIGINNKNAFVGKPIKEISYFIHAFYFRKAKDSKTKKGWLVCGITNQKVDQEFITWLKQAKHKQEKQKQEEQQEYLPPDEVSKLLSESLPWKKRGVTQ